MVRPSGLEPPTPTMSRWCSNQLSYGRIFSCLSWLTAGTNINELPARWQGEKRNFIRYFTRLLRLCAVRRFFPQPAARPGRKPAGLRVQRVDRCRMTVVGCFCSQRMRSAIMMAAKVSPMIKPIQKPLGPIAGTSASVNASR